MLPQHVDICSHSDEYTDSPAGPVCSAQYLVCLPTSTVYKVERLLQYALKLRSYCYLHTKQQKTGENYIIKNFEFLLAIYCYYHYYTKIMSCEEHVKSTRKIKNP
jgi:hypothetical protein